MPRMVCVSAQLNPCHLPPNSLLAHLAAHDHSVGRGRDIFVAVKVALRIVRKGAVERTDLSSRRERGAVVESVRVSRCRVR
jgi:hypothetical protein